MILHTVSSQFQYQIEMKLNKAVIDYQIYPLSNGNINVFFGAKDCVDVIKAIGKSSLADYSAEEDFILGTMLGYDRLKQCRRYLELTQKQQFPHSKPLELNPKKAPTRGCSRAKLTIKECA